MEDFLYRHSHFVSVEAADQAIYVPVGRMWGTVTEGWIHPNWQFIECAGFTYGRLSSTYEHTTTIGDGLALHP